MTTVLDGSPVRSGQVLVLVGLVSGADLPASILERAGAAADGARRAGARVVHLGEGRGEHGEVVAHPAIGRAPGDVTVAHAAGSGLAEVPLEAILGDGAQAVAIAGTPTGGLVAELGDQLAARGLPVVLLDDASDDPDAEAHESALVGSATAVSATDAWLAGIRPPWGPRLPWTRRKPRSRRRQRVSVGVLSMVLILLVSALVVAHNKAKNYFLLSPGSAPTLTASSSCRVRTAGSIDLSLADGQPCARLTVPPSRDHGISGSLLMVDVLEGPASTVDYLLSRLHLLTTFQAGSQLLPASSILGNTPVDQQACQDAQQMVQATTDAPVAALGRLGYDVHAKEVGAQVDLVMPKFPAAVAGLACNDVITSINGHPVKTFQDVSAQLGTLKPGTTVDVGVTAPGSSGTPTNRTVGVRLAPTPAEGSTPAQPDKGFLGVELATKSVYSLPFNVSIDVGAIGGPSAGLALTLGLVDLLSNGHLTGGHRVAATGTIAPDGTVGPIGGLDQKAVAVRNAGAQVFLVPDPVTPQDQKDLATARKEVGDKLKIYPVASLAQALSILATLGGKIPVPSSGTVSASSSG